MHVATFLQMSSHSYLISHTVQLAKETF